MLNFILLQAQQGGGYTQFILFGGMILVFYLFFIRPQQKKQKDQKKFIEAVVKGANIVTLGGIHGKIVSMDDSTVTIDVEKGAKIRLEKSSISMDATKKYQKGTDKSK